MKCKFVLYKESHGQQIKYIQLSQCKRTETNHHLQIKLNKKNLATINTFLVELQGKNSQLPKSYRKLTPTI